VPYLPDDDVLTATIQEQLAGKSVLLTGASGFLGKAVLGQILRELPDTQVLLLLRGDAQKRLDEEILNSGPCEGLDGSRVRVLSGDLGREGLDIGTGIDIVIHCAASVSFEQPLDEALELNSKGPTRLLESCRTAGNDPYFIHVSTAYAAGMRTGLVLERQSRASRSISTASWPRPRGPSAPRAAPLSARAPRSCATSGSASS
jgi:thioester reductase-like protein